MNKMITVKDNSLSLEAFGLISRMINIPENDYATEEDFFTLFKNDSVQTIQNALSELTEKNYLIFVNGKTYAVNKFKLPQIKLV